jgi:hypothetical protein
MAYALLVGSHADWVDVFFTPEGNDAARGRRERELHRELEQHSRASQQMCSSSCATAEGDPPGADSAEGCFRVEPCGDLWASAKLMVWERKYGCYLALACEDMDENVPLASATLQLLRIGLSERLGTTPHTRTPLRVWGSLSCHVFQRQLSGQDQLTTRMQHRESPSEGTATNHPGNPRLGAEATEAPANVAAFSGFSCTEYVACMTQVGPLRYKRSSRHGLRRRCTWQRRSCRVRLLAPTCRLAPASCGGRRAATQHAHAWPWMKYVTCSSQVGACWCWTGPPQELCCMAPC